ncbi:helix-turn-helix transcriptional regulator [Roseibium limicola]|uniref:AraC family transcriptional regulator ligand-binding domain-containing protein n=1 Tax=Roseibium limicola TaxID=2816037 RepID=A0A939EN21_9HYPH|nr:AraC family transcriptional regulator [Roseibium limicola]MBO0345433.1 AraC family transcriptional regulator ligand-binding domain-containing protein [Roseibium limicola]
MVEKAIWARADALGILIDHPRTRHLDWGKILEDLSVEMEEIRDPLCTLPFEKVASGFQVVSEALGDDAAMFDIYSTLPAGTLSVFDYLLHYAPTLREGLQTWVRYIPVRMNGLHYQYFEGETEGGLRWPSLHGYGDTRQNMYARIAWAVGRINLALDISPAPVTIHLEGPPPNNSSQFSELYGDRLLFNQDADAILIAKAFLDLRPTRRDNNLHQLLNTAAAHEIAHLGDHDHQIQDMTETISTSLSNGTCNLPLVAKSLGISPRTLQRTLAKNGRSFREAVEDVRRSNAEKYLTETNLSMKEISFLLGFSQVSTFSRSIRVWFGKPPTELRRSQAGRVAQPAKRTVGE